MDSVKVDYSEVIFIINAASGWRRLHPMVSFLRFVFSCRSSSSSI